MPGFRADPGGRGPEVLTGRFGPGSAQSHDGVGAPLAGAHPDHGLGGHDPDLAVTDLPSGGRRDDGVDDGVGAVVLDQHLDPELGDEVDLVLRPR